MKLLSVLKRFRRDDEAAVGLIFGLALVPMMGLTGVAVDYSRSAAVRNELQVAVDATSLTLAKDSVIETSAQYNTRAQIVFNANWNSRFGASLQSLTVTKGTDKFKVDAKARVDYAVMSIFGVTGGDVSATATSGWGLNKIEIALVLDNTGSMGWSNKMQELKKALCGDQTCGNLNPTTGFVRKMKDAAVLNDQIRVSLVPFDTSVRVPAATQTLITSGAPLGSTFAYTGAGYCNSNPTTAQRVSFVRFAGRDKDTTSNGAGCGTGRITQPTWQGCLWDRDQMNALDTKPSGVDFNDVQTLYPAVTCRSNNLARMTSFIDVKTSSSTLISALATMQPSGNTNLTIGVTWGTNMLTPGNVLSTAAASEPNLQRFMILLTDGTNTENRQTGNSGQIDARAKLACADAKAKGILIYAIRVIEGNQALLKECASGPGYYYEVSNASQIDGVFTAIAGKINSIRLTN
ncbi:MAG: vWA domain-containing protein [Bosea sp. (in: a-proteobacteria)]